ncbi:hypothetical protein D3H35_07605 [Cohnella faecalis]|uniref:Uncharacterized protein n=1 Tax=Cohnella faecalis TaxID=2315694 RepID=A0A398CYY0_9BACL|nr:hypothetical protein D3H35_07605 [Cohnella faecalis]
MKKRRSRKKDKIPFFIISLSPRLFLNYYMEKEQPKDSAGNEFERRRPVFPTDQYPETAAISRRRSPQANRPSARSIATKQKSAGKSR